MATTAKAKAWARPIAAQNIDADTVRRFLAQTRPYLELDRSAFTSQADGNISENEYPAKSADPNRYHCERSRVSPNSCSSPFGARTIS